MTFNDEHDYIVATMLPHMALEHTDLEQQTCEFTVDEARQLYVDGLPLLMNHQDGEMINSHTRRPSEFTRVGTVVASSIVDGNQGLMLASIDPDLSDEATASSNFVAKSIYGSVSLGNTVETRVRSSAEGGGVVVVKTPDEVSLCRLGARPGSKIHAFCPGRSTIERLARYEPADLERLIDVHGYRDAIGALTAADGQRYISALVDASHHRLADIVERTNLRPRPYTPMASKISVKASSDTTTTTGGAASVAATDEQVADALKTVDADAPPSKDVPFIGTAEGEAGNAETTMKRAAESSMTTTNTDATAMAEAALKAQRELVEMKRAFAAQQEANKAQLEELAALKAKAKAEKDAEYEAAVRSAIQYAMKAKEKQADIEADVADWNAKYEADPDKGIAAAKRGEAIMMKAAANVETSRQSQVAQLAAMAEKQSSEYLAKKTAELHALQEADAAISLQLASSTMAAAPEAKTGTFSSASGDALKAMLASEKTAFEQRFSSSEPAVGQKRAATTELTNEMTKLRGVDEVPKFSIKASADAAESSVDTRKLFFDQWKTAGKYSTFREFALGAQLAPTGRMKASVTGEQVPEMRMTAARSSLANFDASTFSPDWDSKMKQALTNSRFGTRGAAALYSATKAVETQGKIYYDVAPGTTELVDGDRDPYPEAHVV